MPLATTYLRTLLAMAAFTLALNLLADAAGYRWLNRAADDRAALAVLPVYERSARAPEVVFLGSSHTHSGVIPQVLESLLEERLGRKAEVWNLGLPAGHATALPYLLDLVFADGRRPRVLMVEADPIHWSELADWERILAPLREYLGGAVPAGDESLMDAARRWADESFYGPTSLWRQGQRLISRGARDRANLPETHGGQWDLRELAEDRARPGPYRPGSLAADRAAEAAPIGPVHIGEREQNAIDAVIRRSALEGAHLVFWTTPMTAEFNARYEAGVVERHRQWVREQIEGTDARFVDLNTPANQDPAMYRDLSHLDPSGAEEAMRQLAEQLGHLLRE